MTKSDFGGGGKRGAVGAFSCINKHLKGIGVGKGTSRGLWEEFGLKMKELGIRKQGRVEKGLTKPTSRTNTPEEDFGKDFECASTET